MVPTSQLTNINEVYPNRATTMEVPDFINGNGMINLTAFWVKDFTLEELKNESLTKVQEYPSRDQSKNGIYNIASLTDFLDVCVEKNVTAVLDLKLAPLVNQMLAGQGAVGITVENLLVSYVRAHPITATQLKIVNINFFLESLVATKQAVESIFGANFSNPIFYNRFEFSYLGTFDFSSTPYKLKMKEFPEFGKTLEEVKAAGIDSVSIAACACYKNSNDSNNLVQIIIEELSKNELDKKIGFWTINEFTAGNNETELTNWLVENFPNIWALTADNPDVISDFRSQLSHFRVKRIRY